MLKIDRYTNREVEKYRINVKEVASIQKVVIFTKSSSTPSWEYLVRG